jgi:hypothetical protein
MRRKLTNSLQYIFPLGVLILFWLTTVSVHGQQYTKASTVVVRLIDFSSGSVVTSIDGRVIIESDPPLTDYVLQPIRNGEIQASVISGVSYRAVLGFSKTAGETVFDREGRAYVIESPVIRFTSPPKGMLVLDYLIRSVNASLSATVLSPDMKEQLNGHISAVSSVAWHRVEAPFTSGKKVELPVIEDVAYVVKVIANGAPGLVAPPDERVIATAGRSTPFQAVFLKADHTLKVTPNVNEAIEGFMCVADAADGSLVLGRSVDALTQEIPLSRNVAAWQITCRANSEAVQYRGSATYTVPLGEKGNLAIELQSRGVIYKPLTVIIPPTDPVVVMGPDNSTKLEVAAKTFPAGSRVELTMKSGTGYPESSSFSPLTAFDIKVTVNDIPTTTLDQPITITFPVDDSLLEEFDAKPEDLYPAYFDETLQMWVRENSFVYDKDTNSIRVTASHFSIWGMLVDLLTKLTADVPSNIKAQLSGRKSLPGGKRSRPRSVVISWDAPEDTTGPYNVQALRVKSRIKPGEPYRVPNNWEEARTYTADVTKIRIRRPAGIYVFRVKLASSANYSDEVRVALK